jgi:hypothetical protein
MEDSEANVSSTTSDPEVKSSGSGLNGGSPIQIVKIGDEGSHSFFLDEEALSTILNNERIRDKPLCIVSVAGTIKNTF